MQSCLGEEGKLWIYSQTLLSDMVQHFPLARILKEFPIITACQKLTDGLEMPSDYSYCQLLTDVVSHPISRLPTRVDQLYHTVDTGMITVMSSHEGSPTILKDKTVIATNMEADN